MGIDREQSAYTFEEVLDIVKISTELVEQTYQKKQSPNLSLDFPLSAYARISDSIRDKLEGHMSRLGVSADRDTVDRARAWVRSQSR